MDTSLIIQQILINEGFKDTTANSKIYEQKW